MQKSKMSDPEWAAWIFVLIGSVNWGMIGLFQFDVIAVVLGTSPVLVRIIHILIGAAGFYWLAKTVFTKK